MLDDGIPVNISWQMFGVSSTGCPCEGNWYENVLKYFCWKGEFEPEKHHIDKSQSQVAFKLY